MKAFILAAGTGSRLQPLTQAMPKALLPIDGVPLLEIIIRKIAQSGIRSVVINIHHHADQITRFLERNENFGLDIQISDESEQLLDTGGALKKAAPLLSDAGPVLVHNVDILSNLSLTDLLEYHMDKGAMMTLAVKQRPTSRSLLIDSSSRICGWEYPEKRICMLTRDNKKGLNPTAFSGVYVISQEVLDRFPPDTTFGMIPWMLDMAATGRVIAWDQSTAFWYEAGRLDSYTRANECLAFDPEIPGCLKEIRG